MDGALKILYEDNHLLIAVKPPGMPSQADSSGDLDMLTALKQYVKKKYQKPGEAWLGLVHRLDRPAGGVMAFARTSKAAGRLSAQIRGDGFKKEYLCVCEGDPPGGRLEHWLTKDERTNNVSASLAETKGTLWAALEYEPLKAANGLTLCRVELITGRPHQIRAQMKAAGFPLWGDQRYNPDARPGQWLALWSRWIELEHPTKKERMRFECMPEAGEGTTWDLFTPIPLPPSRREEE
jgi:23S rRNA pseudouridine1911/1915/1917 synthase